MAACKCDIVADEGGEAGQGRNEVENSVNDGVSIMLERGRHITWNYPQFLDGRGDVSILQNIEARPCGEVSLGV